jgi:hypothetical protein
LRITGEYKSPQREDSLSILTYCRDRQVNYDELWRIKSEESFIMLQKEGRLGVPDVFVFNNKKNPVTNEVNTQCNWSKIDLIFNTNDTIIEIGDSTDFYRVIEHFILVDAQTNLETPDYYIFSNWAKFFPKMSNSVFETINRQKKQSGLTVKHILLNIDYQKDWYD